MTTLNRRLERLERLAALLDTEFRVPGTPFRFGLDGLLGLVPGVGDTLTLIAAAWIVIDARRLGAPVRLVVPMLVNIAIDWLVGLVPVVGDLFDFAWKANRRNVAMLRRHLESRRL